MHLRKTKSEIRQGLHAVVQCGCATAHSWKEVNEVDNPTLGGGAGRRARQLTSLPPGGCLTGPLSRSSGVVAPLVALPGRTLTKESLPLSDLLMAYGLDDRVSTLFHS